MENQTTDQQNKIKKLRGYEFWKSIGEPKHVCAPMVVQSELAFRILVQRYGCDLVYTPMINSNHWQNGRKNKAFREKAFSTCNLEKNVVAQIAGHDPELMLSLALDLQDEVVAIDCNFGCPQGIARRGNYGAYLLSQPDLICSIVKKLDENLKVPVFVKIRILDSEEKTLELAQRIQDSGASALTVHGRTKEEKKDLQKNCNWNIIKKIKQKLSIPVIANGGIYDYQDVERCFQETNCDAVMSAEGLLEYPALFDKNQQNIDIDQLAMEYLEIAKVHNNMANDKEIKAHLFKFFHTSIEGGQNKELIIKLGKARLFEEYMSVAKEFIELRKHMTSEQKRGWYFRWWKAGYTRIDGQIIPNEPVKMFIRDNNKLKNEQQNIEEEEVSKNSNQLDQNTQQNQQNEELIDQKQENHFITVEQE